MTEWRRDTPWRQGHFVKATDALALGLLSSEDLDKRVAMVISHDCDIAQMPDREEKIEIIFGEIIEKADGNYTLGKSSRVIDFECNGKSPKAIRLKISSKREIDKYLFTSIEPDNELFLDIKNLRNVRRWLASRYSRPSFDDEFNDRMCIKTGIAKKLDKLSKNNGKEIALLLFDLTYDANSDLYLLKIVVVYESDPDPGVGREKGENFATKIYGIFEEENYTEEIDEWKNIKLIDCYEISDDELTYKEFSSYQRWNLDHISLKSDADTELALD